MIMHMRLSIKAAWDRCQLACGSIDNAPVAPNLTQAGFEQVMTSRIPRELIKFLTQKGEQLSRIIKGGFKG